MKMEPQEIMRAARKLKDERFAARNTMLQQRAMERFNQTTVDVPAAYRKTSLQTTKDGMVRPSSNILSDEGRQVATLVYAMPVPHIPSPSPEMQAATTLIEKFIIAAHQQLEEHYGPVWAQCTSAQVHDNIGWIFFAPKRKPYKGEPKAPADDADVDEIAAYGERSAKFKQDAGIASVFDYEFATTSTILYDGNVYDPHCVYIWKQVPISTFKKTYGEMENVTGRPEQGSEGTVEIVEYWDRTSCTILCETRDQSWIEKLRRMEKGTAVLDSWEHNWGRVPYFARPCFVTEQLDEDKKFEGPLDGIYNEMPYHKRLLAMIASVSYQTAFAPLKITTKEQGETIVDDSGKPLTFLELEPGKARQLAPGQDVAPVGQSPEVQNLFLEFAESRRRLEAFMLSPVSKGVSPGADTANAALSNLHRFQLSSLDPMARETSRQAQSIYAFMLKVIRDHLDGETVYAFDRDTDTHIALSGDQIFSTNVQAKATPDQGQFQLVVEKHATELWQMRAIDKITMYEKMGYENPEEKAMAVEVEDYAMTLKPVVMQQVTNTLGLLDAVKRMVQENAMSGDARNVVPQLVDEARGMQDGQLPGVGSGSPGQPRENGVVRQATPAMNTQAIQAGGY